MVVEIVLLFAGQVVVAASQTLRCPTKPVCGTEHIQHQLSAALGLRLLFPTSQLAHSVRTTDSQRTSYS